jgi:hypothetical protein
MTNDIPAEIAIPLSIILWAIWLYQTKGENNEDYN